MTRYERRRLARQQAVRMAEPQIDGQRARQDRQEFAESRKRAGWSPALVDQAVSAGPLAHIRRLMDDPPREMPKPLEQATQALGILDAGRRVETVAPHYGEDTLPLQRRTYALPRFREERGR